MTIRQYFEQTGVSVKELSDASGVSQASLRNARAGVALGHYDLGRAVERATRGKVSVREACDPHGEIERALDDRVREAVEPQEDAAAA